MSYYMICPKCGKGTIGRYATDNSLCGECSDNSSTEAVYTESQVKKLTGENKVEKLQEQLNIAKKYIEESYKADKEDNKLLDLIIEDVAKLKSDNETAKKYIEHVIGTIKHDGHLGTIQTDWILPDLEKVLSEIEIEGGGDE